jgi:hypothetical protein
LIRYGNKCEQRERERQRQRDRETERQRDRETERQRENMNLEMKRPIRICYSKKTHCR